MRRRTWVNGRTGRRTRNRITRGRTGRTVVRRTVGLERHENKCHARGLTADTVYAPCLRTGRGVLVSRNGNGVFTAAGYGEDSRTAADNSPCESGIAVPALYKHIEISFGKSAGSKVILNGNGYPASIVVGTAAAAHDACVADRVVSAAVIAAIAAHNIHSFRIANSALRAYRNVYPIKRAARLCHGGTLYTPCLILYAKGQIGVRTDISRGEYLCPARLKAFP